MAQLMVPSTAEGKAVQLVASYSGYDASSITSGDKLSLTLPGQPSISGLNTICKFVATTSPLKDQLLGANPEVEAQISEWLSWCHLELTPLTDQQLDKVNDWLLSRTFLVGNVCTLADLLIFAKVHDAVVNFPVAQHFKFASLLRWYEFISYTADKGSLFPKPTVVKPKFKPPTLAPPQPKVPAAKPAADGKVAAAAVSAPPAAASNTKSKGAAPAAAAPKSEELASSSAGADKPAGEKAGKKEKKAKEAKPKEEKKGGGDKKGDDEARIDMLDIRVGQIVDVGKHPNADALYLEKIDVGEAEPRQVISGLVKFVPVEKMQNRRVLVVCNLKPAKMRDVMSYGMVLCASDDSHENCDPVLIPEGVPLGERITVPGYENDPMEEINPKKKILEKLFPDLKTDADGNVTYKGATFMTSQGAVTATIPSAWVK